MLFTAWVTLMVRPNYVFGFHLGVSAFAFSMFDHFDGIKPVAALGPHPDLLFAMVANRSREAFRLNSRHTQRGRWFLVCRMLCASGVDCGPDSLRTVRKFLPAIAPAMLRLYLVADSKWVIPRRFLRVVWPLLVRMACWRREDGGPAELQEAFEPVETLLVLFQLFDFGHKIRSLTFGKADESGRMPSIVFTSQVVVPICPNLPQRGHTLPTFRTGFGRKNPARLPRNSVIIICIGGRVGRGPLSFREVSAARSSCRGASKKCIPSPVCVSSRRRPDHLVALKKKTGPNEGPEPTRRLALHHLSILYSFD